MIKTLLTILITAACVLGLVWFGFYLANTVKTPAITPSAPSTVNTSTNTIIVTPSPETLTQGTITGSLMYPSEGIPTELTVCAIHLQTNDLVCSNEHLKNPKYTNGTGYALEVLPGTYHVYAYLPSNPSTKAYYSEFVTCGLKAECPSHAPITVTVKANQAVETVDPADWYAP